MIQLLSETNRQLGNKIRESICQVSYNGHTLSGIGFKSLVPHVNENRNLERIYREVTRVMGRIKSVAHEE